MELLLVGLTPHAHHVVLRQREPAALQVLLKQRLGILTERVRVDFLQPDRVDAAPAPVPHCRNLRRERWRR